MNSLLSNRSLNWECNEIWKDIKLVIKLVDLAIIKLINFIWNCIYLYSICILTSGELCLFTVSTTITFTYCLHFRLTIDVLLFTDCGLWNQTKHVFFFFFFFTSFLNDLPRYKIFRSLDRIYKRIFPELFFHHLYIFSILRAKRDLFLFFFFFYFSLVFYFCCFAVFIRGVFRV